MVFNLKLQAVPIKQVNPNYDYVSLSNTKNDLIDASVSIELPLGKTENLDYSDCIVVYFDYDFSNPHSKRTYKLFKHFSKTTKQLIENEFKSLGKLQGLYILSDISEKESKSLIEKFNKRHLSI